MISARHCSKGFTCSILTATSGGRFYIYFPSLHTRELKYRDVKCTSNLSEGPDLDSLTAMLASGYKCEKPEDGIFLLQVHLERYSSLRASPADVLRSRSCLALGKNSATSVSGFYQTRVTLEQGRSPTAPADCALKYQLSNIRNLP